MGAGFLSSYLLKDGTKIWVITEAEGDDGKPCGNNFVTTIGVLIGSPNSDTRAETFCSRVLKQFGIADAHSTVKQIRNPQLK